MEFKDTYKTILKNSKATLLKEKGSKFYAYAFSVIHEDDIKNCLDLLKKEHHSARHWCYAWQLGVNYDSYRANDDGEPTNSAGMPIYGQLQAFNVTNVLVVVVRYFGGTKLGVGGLIQAYKAAAQLSLEESEIVQRTINEGFVLKFDYPEMNKVMRIVKEEHILINHQKLEENCEFTISVRKKKADKIFTLFNNMYRVSIKKKKNNLS
ncbi:MAG: YigZ family protein [Flavobacteriaceae bacterium]|nr:YigZ family protein [Flavobacteriaceae bacterium]